MKKILSFLFVFALLMSSCAEDETFETPSFHIDYTDITISKAIDSADTVAMFSKLGDISFSYNRLEADWLKVEKLSNTQIVFTALSTNEGNADRTTDVYLSSGGFGVKLVVSQRWLKDGALSPDLKVGDVSPDGKGIIYWVNPEDETLGKAVSIDRLTDVPFDIYNTIHGITSETDGAANTEIIILAEKATDPIEFIEGLGEGWYIPALNELIFMFEAYNGTAVADATIDLPINITAEEKASRAIIDDALVGAGAAKLNSGLDYELGDCYWSSTEALYVGGNLYAIRFGSYSELGLVPTTTTNYILRGIKDVDSMDYMD